MFKHNNFNAAFFFQVHYDGFLSIGSSSIPLRNVVCPVAPFNSPSEFIAVYWLRSNLGNVHIFEHSKLNPTLPFGNLSTIATDLTNTFSDDAVAEILLQNSQLKVTPRESVKVADIEHVTVITWNNMRNTEATQTLKV